MTKARNLSTLLDANGDVKQGNLDNVTSYTKSSSDPATNTNGSAGDIWVNHSTNKIYICTDATPNANLWKNVSDATDAVYPNTAPSNPSNTNSFPSSKNSGETFTFTFSGATDSETQYGDSVTHYLVDNISSASLTVSTAEVAAGSAHSFTVGNIASDVSGVTFRVRAKDSNGAYSSGVTVTINLIAALYVTATGGTVTTVGDYKVHTFTSSGTFTVTQAGNAQGSTDVEYLIVGGGGGSAGVGQSTPAGGGGGAGGYRSSVVGESSGRNTSAEAVVVPTAQAYAVTVGAGGAVSGGGGSSSVFGITSLGGGASVRGHGYSGGSGGGGSQWGAQGNGGAGTAGQGYNGGNSRNVGWQEAGGGGGGAGQAGQTAGTPNAGYGGSGIQSSITGTAVYRAGGGGGGRGNASSSSYGGAGGNGGGGSGSSSYHNVDSQAGTVNTGGGAGGGHQGTNAKNGKAGGSGVVILRYKFQN